MEPDRTSIEIRLLGPIELRIDGRDVAIGGPRQRALLALLALRPGQVVAADGLVEELWAGEPTEGADTTLRSYVSRLRRTLGAAATIDRTDRGYVLRVAPAAVDALEFERLVRAGGEALAAGGTRRARTAYAEALALWRGRPLGELAEAPLATTASRLEELRMLATEGRIEADLGLGRAAELIDEIERELGAQPYREGLWHHLMLALYRAGRQADALAAYHRARRTLVEELGIEPGPALRELEASMLRQDVREVARTVVQHNLPSPLTSFVGRAPELEAVGRLLEAHRLVTLTGVGGVGKTRLAIEAARRAKDLFPDGIWFVDLAPLGDPAHVLSSVATVLGIRVPDEASPIDALRGQLADRMMLVVLDNCEHLRDPAADAVQVLLEGAPEVRILATSRVALGVPGEVDNPVPPMTLPRDEPRSPTPDPATTSEAADLFVERARAARPGLPDDAATRLAIERIVADLDGLPLAIELAAARAKAFTVADIASGLSDRFRFLVSWRRLASARHRTLAEAMAWSFDLLEPEEQRLLASMSVLAGGGDLEAIAAICLSGEVTKAQDLVQRLVDASLVTVDQSRAVARYRLLETVRQYAADRLAADGRAAEVAAAHARYFAELATRVRITGPEQGRAVAVFDLERDNLRGALEWARTAGEQAMQRRLTVELWPYMLLRGLLAEGREILDATLAHGPAVAPELLPRVFLGAGNVAWQSGRYGDGRRFGTQLLELGRSTGSIPVEQAAHQLLASIAGRERDRENLDLHARLAVELGDQLEDPIRRLMTRMNYAVYIMDDGRVEPAVPMFEDALHQFRAMDHGEGIGLCLLNLGEAAFLLDNLDDAHRQFAEARAAFESIGFRAHVGHAMQGQAAVEARDGDAGVAAGLLGRAAAILSEVGAAPEDFNPKMVAQAIATTRTALGDAAYAEAYDAGWAEERRASRR